MCAEEQYIDIVLTTETFLFVRVITAVIIAVTSVRQRYATAIITGELFLVVTCRISCNIMLRIKVTWSIHTCDCVNDCHYDKAQNLLFGNKWTYLHQLFLQLLQDELGKKWVPYTFCMVSVLLERSCMNKKQFESSLSRPCNRSRNSWCRYSTICTNHMWQIMMHFKGKYVCFRTFNSSVDRRFRTHNLLTVMY